MVRNIGPGSPCRFYRGQRDRGNNADKRAARREIAKLKGMPGGWKKCLRIQQETARMFAKSLT